MNIEASVLAAVERQGRDATRLLQILTAVQERLDWLPPAALTRIAAELDVPRARVEGVAGFYSFLHCTPAGRYRIRFSDNVTDRMLGAAALREQLCNLLWAECGKASEDQLVSIGTTSCTGMGDQGPALLQGSRADRERFRARVRGHDAGGLGDCARPGVYVYPFGVAVAEVLADCGACDTLAVQVGGASGVTLAGHEFGRRIAFEDVPSAGAFMVFDASRDPFEIAHAFVEFFAHESCGFCTPCRIGTVLLKDAMDKIARGAGASVDVAEMEAVMGVLRRASHCGLGSSAPNPVADTLEKFRPAWERRLRSLDFAPAFDLDAALARRMTGRDAAAAHPDAGGEGGR